MTDAKTYRCPLWPQNRAERRHVVLIKVHLKDVAHIIEPEAAAAGEGSEQECQQCHKVRKVPSRHDHVEAHPITAVKRNRILPSSQEELFTFVTYIYLTISL